MNVLRMRIERQAIGIALLLTPMLAAADPLIASHRGSVSQAPENTLAAFRWAETIGADLFEADLRVAQDGALVVIHDARVNRTTNGRGKVCDLPLSELKALDAGEGQPIPTLEETLAFVQRSRIRLLLDVKDSDLVDADSLIAAIDRAGVRERILIGSRSAALVQSLKSSAPELKVLALAPDIELVREFLALDVDAVRLWARWVRQDPGLVESVRAAGAQVWITTGDMRGNSLLRALQMADGIITNRPAEALYLAQDRGAL